jgi:hypothetical protein
MFDWLFAAEAPSDDEIEWQVLGDFQNKRTEFVLHIAYTECIWATR